jgi:anhydro-N-acetylmuramic acid kinase
MLFIGLMSGTSADGVDAALLDCSNAQPGLVAHVFQAFPAEIRDQILALFEPGQNEIDRLGSLDKRLSALYAAAVESLLRRAKIPSEAVLAIGLHGQTIRHRPDGNTPFSLQIGCPSRLADKTGIAVVHDFRRADITLGGQGAPLVPAAHRVLFSSPTEARAVINLGGIANITYLPALSNRLETALGWDTGPGNCLMDAWIHQHSQQRFDLDGLWALSAEPDAALVALALEHPFFARKPPKSTGRETFTLGWIQRLLQERPPLPPAVVQASLLELTAQSVTRSLATTAAHVAFLCGGGAMNGALVSRLQSLNPHCQVSSTESVGYAPESIEALAFAWLAYRFWMGLPGNLPAVTGARQEAILGSLTPAPTRPLSHRLHKV